MSLGASREEREFYEEGQEAPIVRDRRRIDPETGAIREPVEDEAAGAADVPTEDASGVPAAESAATEAPNGDGDSVDSEVAELRQELGERTQDLQRLQAEYVNYKRRVDRDREAVRQHAVSEALSELLPVLDDIGRAREHGEVEGGFKAVAETLEAALTKLGLEQYGEVGDAFDPRVHEALMHSYSDEVSEASCAAILQPGYRMGERVLRPARVAVAEPTAGFGDTGSDATGTDTGEAAGSIAEGDGSAPPQGSSPGADAEQG